MNVEKVLLNIFYIQNSRMQHLGSFKSTARLSLNLFEHTCQKSKLLEQRTKAEFKRGGGTQVHALVYCNFVKEAT